MVFGRHGLGIRFLGSVKAVDIRLVVLLVMKLHDFLRDEGLKSLKYAGQRLSVE